MVDQSQMKMDNWKARGLQGYNVVISGRLLFSAVVSSIASMVCGTLREGQGKNAH